MTKLNVKSISFFFLVIFCTHHYNIFELCSPFSSVKTSRTFICSISILAHFSEVKTNMDIFFTDGLMGTSMLVPFSQAYLICLQCLIDGAVRRLSTGADNHLSRLRSVECRACALIYSVYAPPSLPPPPPSSTWQLTSPRNFNRTDQFQPAVLFSLF